MKRQIKKITQHIAALMLGVFLILSPVAHAAPNIGTGDVAGDTDALLDSVAFVLNSTGALQLFKSAYLTVGGARLTSGDTLPVGTLVDFIIYVNNTGSVQINDTSIQDVLDPLFAYQALSIRVDNTQTCVAAVCTPGEVDTIYAFVSALGAGSDAPDADTVSFDGTDTIDVGDGSEAGNAQQNAAANAVLAVVFTVQVQ